MMRTILFLTALLVCSVVPAWSQAKTTGPKKTGSVSAKTDAAKKDDLYVRWEKLKTSDPAEAAKLCEEYAAAFPDDKSKRALAMKDWLAEYRKSAKAESPEAAKTLNLTGSWNIIVSTTQGDLQFSLALEQDGTDLTGHVKSPYGEGKAKGKIDGNLITLDAASGPLEAKLKGTIDDGKMKGTIKANTDTIPELKFVGTRAKKE